MAVSALHSAATGLTALSTEIDVVAHNLANVNTAGFKASRVNFEDLIYQEKAQPGVENANGDQRPAGTFVGLGVDISNTQFDFQQGSLVPSARELDWAVEGNGFFMVDILDDFGNGIGFTRAGNFFVNSDGDVVLGNSDGPRLDPPINIPQDATAVEVSSTGEVSAFIGNDTAATVVGQIELATFINPAGLKPLGGNIFIESDASGPVLQGNPGEANRGLIKQKFIEASNVDPVTELISLIKAQRAFELNSQTIQAADESMSVISNLRRF